MSFLFEEENLDLDFGTGEDVVETDDVDIAELKDKITVIDKVIEESKKIRLEIQNNCIPVLNNIASKMINKLTGGKRYGLTMNENFELSLDGKPIDSYSGSTIVLANVAFRIALIEMFFKKSFPVFIGDEIDAYADDTRAQHIHDALVKLEKEGYQLILVSHHALNFQGNKIQLADIKNINDIKIIAAIILTKLFKSSVKSFSF
jgi:DNA repair exonuclease SbcCD ATPase subunit